MSRTDLLSTEDSPVAGTVSRTDLLSTEVSPVAGTVSRTELLSTEDSPVLLCTDGTETSVEWDKQKNVFRARQIIDTCGLVLLLFFTSEPELRGVGT